MDEEEPVLEDILALGGTEDDLKLLRSTSKTTSDVSLLEVSEFIRSIGLDPGEMMIGSDEEEPSANMEEDKKKTKETKKSKKEALKCDKEIRKNGVKTNEACCSEKKCSKKLSHKKQKDLVIDQTKEDGEEVRLEKKVKGKEKKISRSPEAVLERNRKRKRVEVECGEEISSGNEKREEKKRNVMGNESFTEDITLKKEKENRQDGTGKKRNTKNKKVVNGCGLNGRLNHWKREEADQNVSGIRKKKKAEEEKQEGPEKDKASTKGSGSTTKSKVLGVCNIENKSVTDFSVLLPEGMVEIAMATQEAEKQLLAITYTEHKKILVPLDEDETPWFEQSNSDVSDRQYSLDVISHLHGIAKKVMGTELKLYEKARERTKGKDVQWLKTVLSSGTLNDKMAALTVLIQESPVHTLGTVDHFLSMASKKSKRESILAIDTFKELAVADLLPEGRKLKPFNQRPLHELITGGKCYYRLLLLWYYEDQLKIKYGHFLSTLERLVHDPVAQIREKILGVIFDLLYQKPEQEQLLLKLVVNKMGDPNRRIASKCILLLLKLLNHHINMKMVVVKYVEALLYRPNLAEKAQYYTVCFLNQVVISPTDQALALKLVTIYFSFFKLYTANGHFDAKILSALLTGVNRALPFLKTDIPSLEDHMTSLFKIVHVGPLATGIQSLVLVYQVMESRQAVSSRYYRTLYEKLLDPRLYFSSTQHAMFLNLLFKSLKNDPELNRIKAFLKRILQTCSYHLPHFVCGCLVLISEVLKHKPLWAFILHSEADDGEEYFKDVHEECGLEKVDLLPEEGSDSEEKEQKQTANVYSVDKREPLYCRAETSCLWELSKLANHYHPSVQVFAKKLLAGENIPYDGDPLNDFTLLRFLDQFVHKNPKQNKGDHGGSLMQPMGNLLRTQGYRLPSSITELANLDKEKVREDLRFIHEFMQQDRALHQGKYAKKVKNKRKEEDVISSDDEDHGWEEDADFAGELEKTVRNKQEIKKRLEKKSRQMEKQGGSDREDVSDGDHESSDGEYSYSDMEQSDFEDILLGCDDDSEEDAMGQQQRGERQQHKKTRKDEMDEAELEKLLLDNLSSDEDEGGVSVGPDSKNTKKGTAAERKAEGGQRRRRNDSSELFASAEKFAHLLEGEERRQSSKLLHSHDSSQKQIDWEEKRSFDLQKGRRKGGRFREKQGGARGGRGRAVGGRRGQEPEHGHRRREEFHGRGRGGRSVHGYQGGGGDRGRDRTRGRGSGRGYQGRGGRRKRN